MKILDVVKPDLRDVRDVIASELRAIRRTNPIEARRRLRHFQAGMATLEAQLNHSLYHGSSGGSGLSGLLGGND